MLWCYRSTTAAFGRRPANQCKFREQPLLTSKIYKNILKEQVSKLNLLSSMTRNKTRISSTGSLIWNHNFKQKKTCCWSSWPFLHVLFHLPIIHTHLAAEAERLRLGRGRRWGVAYQAEDSDCRLLFRFVGKQRLLFYCNQNAFNEFKMTHFEQIAEKWDSQEGSLDIAPVFPTCLLLFWRGVIILKPDLRQTSGQSLVHWC